MLSHDRHLVFWPAQSCKIIEELCLWKSCRRRSTNCEESERMRKRSNGNSLRPQPKILPEQGQPEKYQAWLKGSGAVMKSLGMEVVFSLVLSLRGRVWGWLRSLRLATSCTAGIGSRASVCMTMGPSLGPELLVRDRIQLTEWNLN